jgi:hypothetical protein
MRNFSFLLWAPGNHIGYDEPFKISNSGSGSSSGIWPVVVFPIIHVRVLKGAKAWAAQHIVWVVWAGWHCC